MLHKKLSNGMEVLVEENHFAQMVAIQCWIGVGSNHEQQGEFGMAHCLEHMLFKGTPRHQVGEISSKVESYGGDINAYTSFDHTVYYLTLSSKYAKEGLDLLSDAVLNSSLDADELEKEKEVILEEIRRSLDSPGHLLGRHIFETIYRNSPTARAIIGSVDSVSAFSAAELQNFYRRWYQPNNMRLVVVGDVNAAEVFQDIEARFGSIEQASPSSFETCQPLLSEAPVASCHLIEGDYEQPRLEVAFAGPKLEDYESVELDIAAFALGAGESSRLNRELRDKKALVSGASASFFSPRFSGVFEISALVRPETYLEAVEAIGFELAKLRYQTPVTQEELDRSIVNMRADRLYQDETVSGRARSLGFSLMTSHKCAYDAVYETRLKAATSDTIAYALDRFLDLSSPTIVGIPPKGAGLSSEDVLQAYFRGVEALKASLKQAKVTKASLSFQPEQLEIDVVELSEGLSLVYRQHALTPFFNLVAVTEGGLRAEFERPCGEQHSFANMLTTASQSLDNKKLTARVEGKGAVLTGFSGRDSIGVKLQCFSEDYEEFLDLWAQCMLEPAFPEQQWQIALRDMEDDRRAELDSPAAIAYRALQKRLYADFPYSRPLYGEQDDMANLDAQTLLKDWLSYRDKGPWTISAVGPYPVETVVKKLKSLVSLWTPNPDKRSLARMPETSAFDPASIKLVKQREQSHVIKAGVGLSWFSPERYALDLVSTLLGGSGGRLFLNLRDRDSLAYTVSFLSNLACQPGVVGAYIACAPHKVDKALEGLRREFDAIAGGEFSASEVKRAKAYLIGVHEAEMQRADAQTMTMGLMHRYGVGYDDFRHYCERISSVTNEEISSIARRLLSDSDLATVVAGPK